MQERCTLISITSAGKVVIYLQLYFCIYTHSRIIGSQLWICCAPYVGFKCHLRPPSRKRAEELEQIRICTSWDGWFIIKRLEPVVGRLSLLLWKFSGWLIASNTRWLLSVVIFVLRLFLEKKIHRIVYFEN